MSMQDILSEFKKLNPISDTCTIPKLEADMKDAADSGNVDAVFYTADYVSNELKAELVKHPDIFEYEAMCKNSTELTPCKTA